MKNRVPQIEEKNKVLEDFVGESGDYYNDYNFLMKAIDKIEHIVEELKPSPIKKKAPAFFYTSLSFASFYTEDSKLISIRHNNEETKKERYFSFCYNFVTWLNKNIKSNEQL